MKRHEYNLQFNVGIALRAAGMPFVMELATKSGRIDVAITDGDTIWGLIECKQNARDRATWQMTRYKSLGLPLLLVGFESDLDEMIRECRRWVGQPGMKLAELCGIPKKRDWRFMLEEEINLK